MPHPGSSVLSGVGTSPPSTRVSTGTGFFVGEVTSGASASPQKVTSVGQYEEIFGAPDADSPLLYTSLDVAFRSGLAEAYVIGLSDVSGDAALEAAATGFPRSLGPGQLVVPDASELTDPADRAAAQLSVISAAAAAGRTALVQLAPDTPANMVTAAGGLRTSSTTDEVAGLFGSWLSVPGLTPGAPPRTAPLAAATAGLIAATDARYGNAAHAPAGDQGLSIGNIGYALGLVGTAPTDSQWDSLDAAGVNLATVNESGAVQLYGFNSLSTDPRWTQLNYHRLRMQILAGGGALMRAFVFRLIDGRGHLFAEVNDALSGYLLNLFSADALWGATAAEAFTVDTSYGPGLVNSPTSVGAGELKAVVTYTPSPHAKNVYTTVISETIQGAAA